MKRKQLWRVLGTGCLAVSLLASPMTGLSALAAGEDSGTGSETGEGGTQDDQAGTGTGATNKKEGGSLKGLNPLQEAKPAVGTEGTEGYKPAVPAYADTEIPVWGFTQDTTVYSVDVEWGAMTFQYENSTWDPKTHTSKPGAGWQVYDSVNDKVVVGADGKAVKEDVINEIKVTNHSNAGVWATLTYAGETDYTDTTGKFSFTTGTGDAETGAADTDVLTQAAADGSVPAYLTLTTAANNLGDGEGVGKETVGKAYFMPDGIKTEDSGETQKITKWTKIGTITVGIKTEEPKAATPPVGP